MKIDSIGHAAILIEANGLRVLSDPWWAGPCFGSQWWLYPKAHLPPVEAAAPDYIYISHGHADHLHIGTLSRLPKTAKCLVSSTTDIAETITRLGFEVWQLDPREQRDLGNGVIAEITPTCNGDTLMVVTDGQETCINLNDAVHAAPAPIQAKCIAELRERYPVIDYLYCGYGVASHFPCCYSVPGKDDIATAGKRQQFFNRQWTSIVERLEPKFAFPFAADVAFLDHDLFWSNEPIHNSERPTDVFLEQHPGSQTKVFDAAPGFSIENGTVRNERLFEPVSAEVLKSVYENEIVKANKVTKPSDEAVGELAELLRENVRICRDYLGELPRDYAFLVTLKDADQAIEIRKSRTAIAVETRSVPEIRESEYDVVFSSRYSYVRRALTQQYGNEVIFVGSGGIFTYRSADLARKNLHKELIMLLRVHDQPPKSRYGDQSRLSYLVKNAIKRVLGRADVDNYDLKSLIGTRD